MSQVFQGMMSQYHLVVQVVWVVVEGKQVDKRNQGGVGSVFNACAGGQAGVPNLAANGQDPSSFAARNLENDPWSAWYGNSEWTG